MYTDTLSLIFNVLAHERSSLHEALYYTMVLSLYNIYKTVNQKEIEPGCIVDR
jgi:hypothetical protein